MQLEAGASKENINFDEIFDEKSVLQSYLDVEAALARAQSKNGVIPEWAAEIISARARIENINMDAVHEGLLTTRHPLVPLIWELDKICGEKAGAGHGHHAWCEGKSCPIQCGGREQRAFVDHVFRA